MCAARNPHFSPLEAPQRLARDAATSAERGRRVADTANEHYQRLSKHHGERLKQQGHSWTKLAQQMSQGMGTGTAWQDLANYWLDASQRSVMMMDMLRQRAEQDKAHEAAGSPPVLDYDSELIIDGCNLPEPVNYQLLRIEPPKGVKVHDWKRPYMIIDPRAGHGAGIGGFKPDSQVGVALNAGHPVYFCVFKPLPEPGQTLAKVMRAEAAFVAEIAKRHPKSSKPVVVGNCQGGWATLVLAAANPEITGPLVINGAPVATWGGHVGENPMRYNGGLLGGIMPALLLADMGNGLFDGAHLVSNFEMLNPSRNFFGKYFDLYKSIDSKAAKETFMEFEKWWGGYHFTTEAEIHWIVEQLFVGNRLARGEAQLEPGVPLDLRNIRSPIIVFASKGDNITPPQQALNWVAETYSDEQEIKVRGQRIIYMVHEKVGHLGIFVSGSIAKKEHAQVTSTLKTIESLPPGLYEMKIEDVHGQGQNESFDVSFHERTIAELLDVVPNDREQERDFAAVARMSELGSELYEMTARPLVQSMVTPQTANMLRDTHPGRTSRRMWGDENPFLRWIPGAAAWAEANRKPIEKDNPFAQAESLFADGLSQAMDSVRDVRDAMYELTFLNIWGQPFWKWAGDQHSQSRTLRDPAAMRNLPHVAENLVRLETAGFAPGVVRMLVLLAGSRGSVRRDRLERSRQVLTTHEAFRKLSDERRNQLITEQAIICKFEPERALEALPKVLPTDRMRHDALEIAKFIVGPRSEMDDRSRAMMEAMEKLLKQPAAPTIQSSNQGLNNAPAVSAAPAVQPAKQAKAAKTSTRLATRKTPRKPAATGRTSKAKHLN